MTSLETYTFVERPKTVQAVQFNGGPENGPAIVQWINEKGVPAMWLDAIEASGEDLGRPETIRISGPDGMVVANVGDVIFEEDERFSSLPTVDFNKKYASA